MSNRFRKSTVKDACFSIKQRIERERKSRREALIQKSLLPYRKYWIIGPIMTRTNEEALAHAKTVLDKYGYQLEWTVIKEYGDSMEYFANTFLQICAKNLDDFVMLTTEEFQKLGLVKED